jgi:tRNA A-37 threonylcarbamoyl transferase component Bud32
MDEQRARGIVRHAMALHVIRPEDVERTGKGLDDSVALLIGLQRESALAPDVVEALGELVDSMRPSRPKGAARMALGKGGGEGGTVAPERDEGSDTLALERGVEDAFRLPGGLKDEFAAAASFLLGGGDGTIAGGLSGGADEAGGTLAGESGQAGGTLAGEGAADGTNAGEAGGTASGTLAGDAAVAGGTLAGGRDAAAPVEVVEEGTLAGLDGAAAPAPPRKLDLGLLSDKTRRRLEDAALAAALIRSGKVEAVRVHKAVKVARDRKVLLQEHLVQEGLVDAAELKALKRDVQAPRRVCGGCLRPFPPEAEAEAACPTCGHQTQGGGAGDDESSKTGTGSGTAAGRDDPSSTGAGTIASGGGTSNTAVTAGKSSSKGIEGFPGEGGTFANYELIKHVAEGGMGVVFKARERTLNRIVALKVMRGGALASKVRRRRFLAEAESAAGLHHPSIVPIHQISEVSGYPFYTMDFVDGKPLDDYVKQTSASGKRIAQLLRTVADAVHHFHLRGIIHRDLKPDNILVTDEGEPKIIDFGIAKKMTSEFDTEGSWTVEGEILGTPHYMPPEQAAGRVQEVDTRSDVYALGAIFYKLVAGKPPYSGLPAVRVVLAIQDDDPTPLTTLNPTLDPDLEAIIGKAMSKERERRYQSALELAQDLERFLADEPILARKASLGYRAAKFFRRYRSGVLATAAVVGVLLVVLAAQLQSVRSRRAQVADLMAGAASAPLTDQPALFAQVLAVDPSNGVALAEKSRAEGELRAQDDRRRLEGDLKLAEAKRKEDLARADLDREREGQRARLLEEADRARREAEVKAREEATGRARALYAQAEQRADEPLAAVGLLTDALALAPEGSGELGQQVAARKLGLCLQLATSALDANQGGLGGYWLQEAVKLEESRSRSADVERLRGRLEYLESGLLLLEEARALIREGKWLLARERLRQAAARGVAPSAMADDQALVDAQLGADARRLVELARSSLQEGKPEQGMVAAREALGLFAGGDRDAAQELLEACAVSAALAARVEAWRLFRVPERRTEALDVLQRAARAVEGTPPAASLERERADRARLLSDAALSPLVYVPEVRALDLEAFYICRVEVTNEEFRAFVSAGGYADPSLWDEEARPLLATFVDATPGGAAQPGPRTWRQGSFGDAANATRPVAGVTWWEARAYARWLSKRDGRRWRLPTEREWQAAAGWDPERQGLQGFPWGDEFSPDALVVALDVPAQVGTTRRDCSPLGVLDAGGNVSEWVELGAPATPALKGASFAVSLAAARLLAGVRTLGTPSAVPPPELLTSIGFRLVLHPRED